MDTPDPPIGTYAPPGYLHLCDVVRAVEARQIAAGPTRLTVAQRRARWDTAWQRTLEALRNGLLRARGQTIEREIFDIADDAWRGGYAFPAGNGDEVALPERAWVVVVEGQVAKVFCLQADVEAWLSGSSTQRRKAGRRPTYSWEKFLHCAYRVIWEDKENIPTQAEHARRALKLYAEESGHRPDEEWAKPHIREIWNSLRLR